MKQKKKKKKKLKIRQLLKLIITAIFITLVSIALNIAPNYIKEETSKNMKVLINNEQVTTKAEILIDEKEIIYMELQDIASFFDETISYDSQNNQIVTNANGNTATVPLEKEEMYINNSKVKIYGIATKKEENFYLPLSEMKNIYNIEINYVKESNTLIIDSLFKEQKRGNATKNTSIKYKPSIFSKTMDKVKKADSLVVVEELKNGWVKVRTSLGTVGYTKNITNIYTVREQM